MYVDGGGEMYGGGRLMDGGEMRVGGGGETIMQRTRNSKGTKR